jgi:hypothetical protein
MQYKHIVMEFIQTKSLQWKLVTSIKICLIFNNICLCMFHCNQPVRCTWIFHDIYNNILTTKFDVILLAYFMFDMPLDDKCNETEAHQIQQ